MVSTCYTKFTFSLCKIDLMSKDDANEINKGIYGPSHAVTSNDLVARIKVRHAIQSEAQEGPPESHHYHYALRQSL